jgi:hypothetical protein
MKDVSYLVPPVGSLEKKRRETLNSENKGHEGALRLGHRRGAAAVAVIWLVDELVD